MQRNYLQRLGDYHSWKVPDEYSLEGKLAARLARGCTASSVAESRVLQVLVYGLQEAGQLDEHRWGEHHNGREASEAFVLEMCLNRRKA